MPEELLAQGISLDDDMVTDDVGDENPMYADPVDEEGGVKKVVPVHTDDEEGTDDLENPDGDDDASDEEELM